MSSVTQLPAAFPNRGWVERHPIGIDRWIESPQAIVNGNCSSLQGPDHGIAFLYDRLDGYREKVL
ncbi:MAG: hypothetical protein M1399_09755 [Actinobacteria bacterium]|nr:hypothetical protein [Actinomycetota bacterium]MCL5447402.1 hypothetical protein [Actinomycetota bacterium]